MGAQQPRMRVSALCIDRHHVLLVKHRRFAPSVHFPDESWILPGGGVEYGESLSEALRREVQEETGYACDVGRLLFVKELIFPFPEKNGDVLHHSISLGFLCAITGGSLMTGRDPEFGEHQLIIESNWLPIAELSNYVLYPPFLSNFIVKGHQTNFSDISPKLFESHE